MKRRIMLCILGAAVLAIGVLAISHALAQPAQPPSPPRQPGMMMPMMGMPMMMGGGSLVASGNYIYVLWAGSIYVYQFDTKEKKLTQVTSVELPRPPMPQFPPAGFPGAPQFGPPAGGAFFPPQPPQQMEPLIESPPSGE